MKYRNIFFLILIIFLFTSLSSVVSADTCTGGNITIDGNNTIHTFLSNDTFTNCGLNNIEIIIVAGGGAGGAGRGNGYGAGGGGAGGLIYDSNFTISSQSYNIVIGAGGTGGIGKTQTTPSIEMVGINGENSTFSTLIAIGGGGGGGGDGSLGIPDGKNGGSGGGSSISDNSGNGTVNQGSNGGEYNNAIHLAGGGGGAGQVGSETTGGGGNGLTYSISGSSITYAGGGGAGRYNGAGGVGGAGGGGDGGATPTTAGGNGIDGLGGGGGAGGTPTGGVAPNGGNGGDGIVIIRYLTPPLNNIPIVNNILPLNNSASGNPILFSGFVNDSDDNILNCSLYINDSLVYNFTNIISENYFNISISNSSYYSFNTGETYNYYFNCYDGFDSSNSSLFNFEFDINSPFIVESVLNGTPNFDMSITTNITLNTVLWDFEDNLFAYSYNITDNSTVFYSDFLINYTGGNITINDNILLNNITSNYPKTLYYNVHVEDWHTKEDITKDSKVTKDEINKKIIFNYKNKLVSSEPKDKDKIESFEYVLLKDKVKDNYCYKEKNKYSWRTFIFKSNDKIYYNPNSKYKGHFATSGGIWRDYDLGNNYIDETYKITKINDYEFEIEIYSKQNCLIFNSFGGLNIAEETFEFTLTDGLPDITINEITTDIEGLQNFTDAITLTTYANYSNGSISFIVDDDNLDYYNATIINSSGTVLFTSLNDDIYFNLLAGTYNITLFAIDEAGFNSTEKGYFTVNQCSENWEEQPETCVYPDITYLKEHNDLNSCGTFQNTPVDYQQLTNCSYVSIQGNINCLANPKPLIKTFSKIEWICHLNNTGAKPTSCFTYVSYNNNIIQTNPKPKYVTAVGLVDYFSAQPQNSNYQSVSVHFDSKDLKHNEEVLFSVRCNSEVVYYEYDINVTPQYKELSRSIVDRTVWLKDNWSFILIFLIGLTALMIIVGYMWKKVKGG